jgi:eukaryotic-like serine/threonine-protein kinase
VAGREGTTLGPYRLTRRLGAGGAGEVYLAEGPARDDAAGLVAIKVLRGGSSDETAREIARQAHLVSSLHQAHVLPVYSVAEDGGAIYLAMAYAPGGSLGTAISSGGSGGADHVQLPMSAGVVARLVTQVARPLLTIHQQGVVHGDLKLENLFVRTAPHGGPLAAVADFGQSSVVRAALASAGAGDTGWASAALLCAAPEQLAGHLMPASDQYALATIAYLLLTGTYPFSGDARTLGVAILREPPAPPTQLDPTISPAVEATLLRALAKDPAARFADIAAFAQALDEGLAASKLAGTGVTQQFSLLAGVAAPQNARGATTGGTTGHYPVSKGARPPATASPFSAASHPTASGVRAIQASPSTDRPGSAGGPGGATPRPPRSAGPGLRGGITPRQRIAAAAAGVVALALVVAGVLGLRALTAPPGPSTQLPNFGGLDYAPTPTADATQVVRAQATALAAQSLLTAATSVQPVFSDSLSANSQHWTVDGTSTFFGTDDQLHLYNQSARTILSLNQPAPAPADFAVTVNMVFLRGSLSDPAGVNFRVTPSADGPQAHYTVLISAEGRYEFWRFEGAHWAILDSGYSDAVKRGLGQTNQLAVLARGSRFWMFVNGQYVTSLVDSGLPGTPQTTMGLIVIYSGCEVGFTHYTVYRVNP